MPLAVDHPWCLALLLLCVPALRASGATWHPIAALPAMPADMASRALDGVLRLLAACAIAGIVLGLAGLHRGRTGVLRAGRGAHIVMVLDRSLSMDEAFAMRGGKAAMSKTQAAALLLGELFARRPHDQFGIVAFSTQAITVMPLTAHRPAIAAALAAMRQKALANTEIGGGLAEGLSLLARDAPDAPHVLIFVSDGAGIIPDATQDYLRQAAFAASVHLYYLYLRAGDEPALNEDISGRNDSTRPAALDAFFRSLGVPYHSFEAHDPGAVAAAVRLIDRLETRPVTYTEIVPRRDDRSACYGTAAFCLLLVLLARLAQRDFPAAMPVPDILPP